MEKTFEDALNELIKKYRDQGTSSDEIGTALEIALDVLNDETEN